MNRIFLTGATGFIGSHVARLLLSRGCEVTAMVRPGANLARLEDIVHQIDLVQSELDGSPEVEERLRTHPPDVALHLAWHAVPGEALHDPTNLDCLVKSVALLRLLNRVGCPRLVCAGTSVEYDTDNGYVSESSAIKPRNLYAASKHAFFLAAEQFQRQNARSFAWARIFSVYGPWEHPKRLVPDVARTLLRGEPCPLTRGEQVRDYLHVEDAASALVALAASPIEGAMNIGSGRPISVREVAGEIGRLLGRPELLLFGARPCAEGEPRLLVANATRLETELGWLPRYTLRAGLEHAVSWWERHAHHRA